MFILNLNSKILGLYFSTSEARFLGIILVSIAQYKLTRRQTNFADTYTSATIPSVLIPL